MRKTRIALLVAALMGSSWAAAAEADLNAAKALLEAGKPAEAYALLAPHEFDNAGNQDFDYLLAVAALDSGQPDKAILMFDRILTVNPNFAGARMDMGRAYFALKNDQAAKEQFNMVMSQNPPEVAKATAQKYLDAIAQREASRTNRWTAYAEGGFGHDSNVNASTSQGQIVVPALNNAVFNLSSNNLETSSNYFFAGGGAEYTHMLTPNVRMTLGGDVRKRNNTDASQFNSENLAAYAGFRFGEDENNVSVTLNKSRYYLNSDPNRDTTGVSGVWQYTVNPRYQISLFGAYNLVRYVPQSVKNEDINQTIGGIGWLYALDPEGKTLLSTSLFFGYESEHRQRADGSKAIRGLRVGGFHSFRDDLGVFGSVGIQEGDYKKENAAFLKERQDYQYDLSLGLNWRAAEQWSVRPQVSHSRNNSNINLYEYDRTDVSVTARWDFR
jgi:tetratricopeptide (TPR) repeat protein